MMTINNNKINKMEKKIFFWMLAATLVCCASVFTSCKSDDDDNAEVDNSKLTEKLVGKWLYNEADGEVVETDEASITTFVMEGTTLKAYISTSLKRYGLWAYKQPTDVKIDGNKLTLTMQKDDITTVEEYTDISVTDEDLYYTSMYTTMRGGKVIEAIGPYRLHCTKVHTDYAPLFIGRWEGTITSDEPGFVPRPFCEKYLTDGTNIEYELIDGQWVPVEAEYAEFFIDGNLLCTRWKYPDSEEGRTNCIFESYNDGTMILKEVVNHGGKLYTETSTLTKVSD